MTDGRRRRVAVGGGLVLDGVESPGGLSGQG